jgi:16S rRNA (guanine1516-N2)-methyltransferase
MSVLAGDSKTLRAPAGTVIYLDPMFPERKKAAAVKKEAVMLQRLADQTDDSESLWEWAWDQPVERIVVKRPLRAPILGHIRPAHTLRGKSVRFDVFTRRLEHSL